MGLCKFILLFFRERAALMSKDMLYLNNRDRAVDTGMNVQTQALHQLLGLHRAEWRAGLGC